MEHEGKGHYSLTKQEGKWYVIRQTFIKNLFSSLRNLETCRDFVGFTSMTFSSVRDISCIYCIRTSKKGVHVH